MKEIGEMIKQMDLGTLSLKTERNDTQVNGKMICTMGMALRVGLMGHDSMAISLKVRRMALEHISGQMVHFILVIG